MLWEMIKLGGTWMYPMLALSIIVLALILERLLYWRRVRRSYGEHRRILLRDAHGHDARLRPLSSLAVTLGLFGSVVGMVAAFAGFQGQPDPERVRAGLAVAFYTTEAGMTIAIASMLACYFFNLMARRYAPAPRGNAQAVQEGGAS